MKLPPFLFACLVAVSGFPGSSLAQTTNHLDVRLVGPWILYQDNNFKDAKGHVVPVLIVMSPGMGNIASGDRHEPPIFGNGDGDWVSPQGVYCVTFDYVCAQSNPNGKLRSDGYPGVYLLEVSVPSKWAWNEPTTEQADATYLILPMPDSISNESLWPMEFAPKSDKGSPHGPHGYSSSHNQEHSIGLHLHYTTLTPSHLDFVQCDPVLTDDSASSCTVVKNDHPLINTGTLNIVMKAPNTDDPCDPHVRAAYREMLLLLDDTDLDSPPTTNPNVNQQIAFIDPAVNVDQKGAVFDDDTTNLNCRGLDDPSNVSSKNSITTSDVGAISHEKMKDVFAQLNDISDEIALITNPYRTPHYTEDSYQLLPIKNNLLLDSKRAPSIPQMAVLAKLISVSKKSLDRKEHKFTDPEFKHLLRLEVDFLFTYDNLNKGAKDCLAAIMIIDQ